MRDCTFIFVYFLFGSIVDLQHYTGFKGTAILISGVRHSDSVIFADFTLITFILNVKFYTT